MTEIKWSDLFSSSSEEEEDKYAEGSGSESDEEIDPESVIERIEEDNDLSCSCKSFNDKLSCLNYLINIKSNYVMGDDFRCVLSNFSRVFNLLSDICNDLMDPARVMAVDLFYRTRHELLFRSLMKSLNLPEDKTDVCFDQFGVDSKRTPDLIMDFDGLLLIIEVSATSSFDRAAMSKGLEEAGFESKYQKELDELEEMGVSYVYIPFLFDMSSPGNLEYEKGFNKLPKAVKVNEAAKKTLQFFKELFCVLSIQLKNYTAAPSAILFNRLEPIGKDHRDLSFLLRTGKGSVIENNKVKNVYKEFCVSPPVYNKLISNWHRLYGFFSKYDFDEKVSLVLDASNHKIFTTTHLGKHTVEEFCKVISNNDKFNLFKMLTLKVGRGYVSAIDSNDGVKFIEKTNEVYRQTFKRVEEFVRHPCCPYENLNPIDFGPYKQKIDTHYDYQYNLRLDYGGYEEHLIDLITKNDREQNYEPGVSTSEESSYELRGANLIAKDSLDSIDIDESFESLRCEQLRLNTFDESLPIKIQKNKNPFLLPLAQITSDSYTKLNFKNSSFLHFLKNELASTDPYTSLIFEEAYKDEFEFIKDVKPPSEQYNELVLKKVSISREITRLCRDHYKMSKNNKSNLSLKSDKDSPLHEDFKQMSKELSKMNKMIEVRGKLEKISNETQLIRLPTRNKKTALGNKFLKEMKHYKDKSSQSIVSGIGSRDGVITDYLNDRMVFDNITEWMTGFAGENPNLVIDSNVADDVKLLEELKKSAVKEYTELISSIKNSFLGHSAAFVSNLAHSLLYYSQMPFNSDYVRIDNLGLKNVFLIVRGGKKIFKSKSSKMFRLVYPVNECILPWLLTGKGEQSSTRVLLYNDTNYLITPWQSMHESILNDSISFYTRIVSFVALNLSPKNSFGQQFSKVSFNVMLAYHNRRQTEVMLANLRYILLATLGDLTGIVAIFKEFLGFNYDCFQSYARGCILTQYPNYFKVLLGIKSTKNKTQTFQDYIKKNPENLFSGSSIGTEEELALMIYSTFLMTKAPYQRPAERARNLKGILDIHTYFDEKIGLDNTIEEFFKKTTVNLSRYSDLGEYTKEIFSNDFYFDPGYCAQIGDFADSYYNSKGLKEDFFIKWNSILNQSWDELATSTGLRGRFDDISSFWGQKGYFVVYKDLMKNKSYMESLSLLIKSDLDSDKKRKMLRDLNIVYKAKITDVKDYLLFHAVDKVQWRGGREIYVMDIETKTVQQPIEKFMGYLCGKLDNELISIPSDRRAQVIHHSIFEKDLPMQDMLTWYLTLDCSKWAPKSNYLKFLMTILPMEVLPPTFKTHFMNYTQKLFKKRIYFNEAEVNVLKNNPTYQKIVDKYLLHDQDRNGYYMMMPYSWVMGIFNYTSSFLHSLNQKYSEYIIFKTSLISFSEETTLKMYAHSDDSGGRVTCKSNFFLTRCLSLYELQLKMCNHLLSKKKSVVSRFYFEILSVIYLFKKLLALLPKFLGGIRFLPSDKGPAQDMLASYSKCIEVMVAGASFNLSYMVMKFYSAMVYRFYFNKRGLTARDYLSPPQYLGMPDSHPLMVLLCGSDSDIVRLISTGRESDLIKENAIISSIVKTIDDEGPIKPIKFNISVRGLKKGFEDVIEHFKDNLNSWSISNVNFHSTPFNFLTFLRRLSDPGFVGSLVNESTTRRLSRAYFMRKGKCVSTTVGLLSIKELMDFKWLLLYGNDLVESLDPLLYEEINNDIDHHASVAIKQIEVLKETLVSPLRICRYMMGITLEGKQIVKTFRTLKPTHVELLKSSRTFTHHFDPAQMVSYIKEPEVSWALPNIRNLYTAKSEVEGMCLSLGFNIDDIMPSTLLKLCRNYGNKHTKEIYMYSRIPGEIRNVKTYSAFLTFLATNTYSDCEVKGLVLNLKKNMTDPGYLNTNIDEDIYIINNILSIIHIFTRASDIDFIMSLSLKPLPPLGFEGGGVDSLMSHLEGLSRRVNSEHFYFQFSYLKNYLLGKFNGECRADFLSESSYYFFPKSQKSKSGWFGSGKMTVCVKNRFYTFGLYNNLVISAESNCHGKLNKDDMAYINDVFNKSGLRVSNRRVEFKNDSNYDLLFGMDYNGDYNIGKKYEIEVGIPALHSPAMLTPTTNKDFLSVKYIGPNTFLLTSDVEVTGNRIKVYTLPLLQGEILNLIRMVFKPEEFEMRMLEGGLNDFEDYILTEIMTNFGFEAFVNPNDFFDNYQSSKLFSIIKSVKENGYSRLPNKVQNSVLPAGEGGLLRVLIDYSRLSNDKVIKTPGNLTPEIMELRSQYPESVSVVLSESLREFHTKIYTSSEQMEIHDAYQKLYKYKDYSELQKNAIKLMTHWGYGSLVHSIENYTMSKNIDNFWYFAMDSSHKLNSTLSKELFLKMHKYITESILDFKDILSSLDLPLPNLKFKGGEHFKFISQLNTSIANCNYSSVLNLTSVNYYFLVLLNYLAALFEDEDFINQLGNKMKEDYILCTLELSHKNRGLFISLYNTFYYNYICVVGVGEALDFTQKVHRLSTGITHPKVYYDEIKNNNFYKDNLFNYNVNYFNFLNNDLVSFFKSAAHVYSKGVDYRVSNTMKKKSDAEVPVSELIPLEHMYNPEVFDTEEWEEVIATMEAGDATQEDIDEYYNEIKNRFIKPKTKKLNLKTPTVQCEITWVIDPFMINNPGTVKFYRQSGENLAIVATELQPDFLNSFPNSHCRVVNLSKKLKRDCPTFLVHISCNKMLDKDFWDILVGGQEIRVNPEMLHKVFVNKVLVKKGVIGGVFDLGMSFEEIFDNEFGGEGNGEGGEKEGVPLDSTTEEGEPLAPTTEKLSYKGKNIIDDGEGETSKSNEKIDMKERIDEIKIKIKEKIDRAYDEKVISRGLRWRLIDKYVKEENIYNIFSIEEIFLNCMNEISLGEINKDLKSGTLKLTKEDYVKVFLAPEHFGLAQSFSRNDPKNIKDKKVCAEINSLNMNLAQMIASGTLSISKGFQKIVLANYKLWVNSARGTRYKRENKKFLIILFLMIMNTAQVFEESKDDYIWQNMLNLITPYIADDGPDEEDDEEFLDFDTNIIHGSRLFYKATGF